MIEILPALEGFFSAAKAMASFDAFRKGRKGDARALIEELKANSRLCFRIIEDGAAPATIIGNFSTSEFDRLNKAGFNFNGLKSQRIPAFPWIANTDLASWSGKTTSELVENIYDKIKNIQSIQQFAPDNASVLRRIKNIHKRLLLLLRHAKP